MPAIGVQEDDEDGVGYAGVGYAGAAGVETVTLLEAGEAFPAAS
jgi:hypothetical protein